VYIKMYTLANQPITGRVPKLLIAGSHPTVAARVSGLALTEGSRDLGLETGSLLLEPGLEGRPVPPEDDSRRPRLRTRRPRHCDSLRFRGESARHGS